MTLLVRFTTYKKKYKNNTGDNQMYQEIELKPSQNTMLIEKEWPEKKLHLASHQLISMLNKFIKL